MYSARRQVSSQRRSQWLLNVRLGAGGLSPGSYLRAHGGGVGTCRRPNSCTSPCKRPGSSEGFPGPPCLHDAGRLEACHAWPPLTSSACQQAACSRPSSTPASRVCHHARSSTRDSQHQRRARGCDSTAGAHRCRNSRARAMKRVSSASDTKSEADSRMLSRMRPQLVMAHAFSATCAACRGCPAPCAEEMHVLAWQAPQPGVRSLSCCA